MIMIRIIKQKKKMNDNNDNDDNGHLNRVGGLKSSFNDNMMQNKMIRIMIIAIVRNNYKNMTMIMIVTSPEQDAKQNHMDNDNCDTIVRSNRIC